MADKRCPNCGNYLDHRFAHRCNYPLLVNALELRGVALTDEDRGTLRWLAGWDRATCERIASLFERAARGGSR